jgi:hypothetical protein
LVCDLCFALASLNLFIFLFVLILKQSGNRWWRLYPRAHDHRSGLLA